MSQLSVNPDAVSAATQGNMAEFVKALEKDTGAASDEPEKETKAAPTEAKKKDDEKDDQDFMQLD